MNTKNNKLIRATDEQIIRTIYEMMAIEKMPVSKITVREICTRADIHRSTFYAHYQDVYDVVEKVEKRMAEELTSSFLQELDQHSTAEQCFVRLFEFILKHKDFYTYYLTEVRHFRAIEVAWDMVRERYGDMDVKVIGVDNKEEMDYHGAFFLFGMTAMIRYWLEQGCNETPEELYAILRRQAQVTKQMVSW